MKLPVDLEEFSPNNKKTLAKSSLGLKNDLIILTVGRMVERKGHDILIECVKRSGLRDSYVEMIVTRGIPLNGERDPRKFSNRFYAYAIPYVWIVRPEDQVKGVHLAISNEAFRIDPKSVDPKVKNFHWHTRAKIFDWHIRAI